MTKKTVHLFLLAAAGLLSPAAALADSDGDFCIGPGYVAVEARGIYLPSAGHSVRIVRVSPDGGIFDPVSVEIEPFQSHGMYCLADRIVFTGGYVVDLSDPLRPKDLGRRADVEVPEGAAQGSLPFLRASSAVEIPVGSGTNQFSLVLGYAEESRRSDGAGYILHHFSARVVQWDASRGAFISSETLAEGVREETVD